MERTHDRLGISGDDVPLGETWAEPIRSERLDLILLSAELIDAVLSAEPQRASALAQFRFPDGFPDGGDREFLRFRRAQLAADPSWAPWLVRAIVRRDDDLMVGTATFHGPPGINDLAAQDAAEAGYTIFPDYRRRGYATEAAEAMIRWAYREHGVRHFVAGIAPENLASLRVIEKLGFRDTGVVDDGELIFEFLLEE